MGDHPAGVAHPLVEQPVVTPAQPVGQTERPDLLGLESTGEQALVVGAVSVQLGQAVAQAIEGLGVAHPDHGDRDVGERGDGHQQRGNGQEHGHDGDDGEQGAQQGDQAPHDLPGVGVGVLPGPLHLVVELGVFEGLELGGGGRLQQLIHRSPMHQLVQQDAQLGDGRGHQRRADQQQSQENQPRQQVTGGGVGALRREQLDELAPDEELARREQGPHDAQGQGQRELSGSGGGDQREGQPSGIEGTPDTFGV